MIVTKALLFGYELFLASHQATVSERFMRDKEGDNLIEQEREMTPKLVFVSWAADEQSWHTLNSLKRAINNHDLDISDMMQVRFVHRHSLNKSNPEEALLLNAIAQLSEYARGERHIFDLPIDMSVGTPFQQTVWRALRQIPYGETLSYATLAERIGKPTAYRAVANANGRNPFTLIIPCHRVIASSGGLGGYTGGLDKKEFLLSLERRYATT